MKWKLITVCIAAAACLIIRSPWISVTVLAVCIAMMLIEDILEKRKVEKQVKELTKNASDVLVVELNLGQMYYEVDRVLSRDTDVHLMGQIGGLMPTPDEILSKIKYRFR